MSTILALCTTNENAMQKTGNCKEKRQIGANESENNMTF